MLFVVCTLPTGTAVLKNSSRWLISPCPLCAAFTFCVTAGERKKNLWWFAEQQSVAPVWRPQWALPPAVNMPAKARQHLGWVERRVWRWTRRTTKPQNCKRGISSVSRGATHRTLAHIQTWTCTKQRANKITQEVGWLKERNQCEFKEILLEIGRGETLEENKKYYLLWCQLLRVSRNFNNCPVSLLWSCKKHVYGCERPQAERINVLPWLDKRWIKGHFQMF